LEEKRKQEQALHEKTETGAKSMKKNVNIVSPYVFNYKVIV
jgi:hypothetical protein